jgi:hypothetical protein
MNYLNERTLNIHLPEQAWGELATISQSLMELTWVTPWYIFLVHPGLSWPVVTAILVAISLVTYLIARRIDFYHWSNGARRLFFALWLIVIALGSLNFMLLAGENSGVTGLLVHLRNSLFDLSWGLHEFWHILILILLMSHMISHARQPVEFWRTLGAFQIGMMMVLLGGLIYEWSDPLHAIEILSLFLLLGLLCLSCSRISDVGLIRGGKLPVLKPSWILIISLATAVLVAVSISSGWLVSGRVLSWVTDAVVFIITLIVDILLIVLYPVMMLLVNLLVILWQFLTSILDASTLAFIQEWINQLSHWKAPEVKFVDVIFYNSRPVILGGILLLVFLTAIFNLYWQQRKQRLFSDENAIRLDRLSPRSPGYAGLFNRLFASRKADHERLLAAARIRQIYADLLDLAARLESPRPAAATPLEYLPVMDALFPGQTAALELITRAYLKVRYGELPENIQQVREVQSAWEAIKSQGKKLLAKRKRTPLLPLFKRTPPN